LLLLTAAATAELQHEGQEAFHTLVTQYACRLQGLRMLQVVACAGNISHFAA
jgi:hypothetical protein